MIGLKGGGWSNPLMASSRQSICSTMNMRDPSSNVYLRGQAAGGCDSFEMDELAINNVVTMVCFATALMENLARMNKGK